ncbi:hypothetical protein HPB48_025907 [Haemaphysalis longicornis]|uniref:THAP-type domain-containing protein n=1 Tax=Haemaphysalis longicornis TaxID=44386 RepID=A0A9J6HAS6_HAELO|nr:hypothetical protein HPB48_025907 [Haemaphysalis longicornis]
MPKTCCVPGCRSGYRGTSEKVSLFCLPSSADKREQWKRAIPRQEAAGFSFDSHHVRVCEKHFDTADVVWNDTFLVKGDVVSLRREKPKLRPDAIPRRFDWLPAYLRKPKPRSRSTRSSQQQRYVVCRRLMLSQKKFCRVQARKHPKQQ